MSYCSWCSESRGWMRRPLRPCRPELEWQVLKPPWASWTWCSPLCSDKLALWTTSWCQLVKTGTPTGPSDHPGQLMLQTKQGSCSVASKTQFMDDRHNEDTTWHLVTHKLSMKDLERHYTLKVSRLRDYVILLQFNMKKALVIVKLFSSMYSFQ